MREWLTVIIVVVIIGVLLDGIRRMRQAKRNTIKMSLGDITSSEKDPLETYGSELPNGGARIATRDEDDAERVNSQLHQVIDPYRHNKRDKGASTEALEPELSNDDLLEYEEPSAQYEQLSAQHEEPSAQYAEPSVDYEEPSVYEEPLVNEEQFQANEKLFVSLPVEQESGYFQHNETGDTDSSLLPVDEQIDTHSLEHNKQSLKRSIADDLGLEDVNPDRVEPRLSSSSTRQTISVKSQQKAQKKMAKTLSDDIAQQASLPFDDEHSFDEGEDILSPTRTHKPITTSKSKSKKAAEEQAKPIQKTIHESIEEVFVIHIKSSADQLYCGKDFLPILHSHGAHFGNMNIFHTHEDNDPNAPVIFSIANMVMPGIFDLSKIEQFNTPGLSLFLNLPLANTNGLLAFNQMLELAHNVTQELGGEINDENRSVVTRQTAEHYRERISDFTRRQHIKARA